ARRVDRDRRRYPRTPVARPPPGLAGACHARRLDPARRLQLQRGSNVPAAHPDLLRPHGAGPRHARGAISAGPRGAAAGSVQVQVKRAANNGLGGSTYGETSIFLMLDSTHYAEVFIASGKLTAWLNTGGGESNQTPSWPGYNAANMQWLRFREAGGRLYWE